MSQEIPPSAYAIAAYEAARLFGEDPADVFDPDAKSRARVVAILALRRAFPKEHQITISHNMGIEGSASHVSKVIAKETNAKTWDDRSVDYVEKLLAKALRRPITVIETHREILPQPDERKSNSGFKPRVVRPARIITPSPKPANVTALLMGDPSPGRREFLAATPHNNYAFVEKNSRRGRL